MPAPAEAGRRTRRRVPCPTALRSVSSSISMPCAVTERVLLLAQGVRRCSEVVAGRTVTDRGHPHRRAVALMQPARETHVVRMIVRDEDPAQRATLEIVRLETVPRRAADVVGQARVHQHPAVFVPQQPDVDVVQLHRQRNARPAQAGADLDGAAGFRRLGLQVIERPARRRVQLAFGGQRTAVFAHRRMLRRYDTTMTASPSQSTARMGQLPNRT